ncbi:MULTISPECIES: hypothetical protein [unclassified Streptomyces]|uniref:hypothetical protein n=1 Tax=unclassified Streptomyces TaxID=2593676 RepID=UPI00403C0204
MSADLNKDLDQIPPLVSDFDFLHVEYELPTTRSCANSRHLKPSSPKKKDDRGTWRRSC